MMSSTNAALLRRRCEGGRPEEDWGRWKRAFLRASAYVRGRLVRMVRPEWPYAAAREQILSDESGGCSGAEEVAGEARPSQGASPQANAERVRREADKGGAGRGVKTNKAGKGRKFPHPVMAITAGTSQGELTHTQN